MSAFSLLKADNPDHRAAWLRVISEWPNSEPFAHPSYIESFLGEGEQALCAVQQLPSKGNIMLPCVLRPIEGGAADVITPYGYGGAFSWGDSDPQSFWAGFLKWAREANVVTLFARLSLFPEDLTDFPVPSEIVMPNVVRSLAMPLEDMWMDFEHKVRKNIKKAERNGLSVEVDPTGDRLDDFLRIYEGTMDRRNASQGYYFGAEFFRNLKSEMQNETCFFHVLHDGKVISTELVLVGGEHTYSFLGGTDSESFDLRPNDLLKYEIIQWSKKHGKTFFVLGGGPTAGDGIFRYKLSLAPNDGVREFSVVKWVIDAERNAQLVASRMEREPGWKPCSGYFPVYRAPSCSE